LEIFIFQGFTHIVLARPKSGTPDLGNQKSDDKSANFVPSITCDLKSQPMKGGHGQGIELFSPPNIK